MNILGAACKRWMACNTAEDSPERHSAAGAVPMSSAADDLDAC